MNKALILNFNNYFNRILKIRNTKEKYLEYGYEYSDLINFEPNDGVDTSQIFNLTLGTSSPDYIVILDEQDNIVSRWFVIEMTRTRMGQYKLDLRRDLIADYYIKFAYSKSLIERGWIKQTQSSNGTITANPLIFNSEPLQFNKIKKGEYLLSNKAKCPWLMVYWARSDNEGNGTAYAGKFYKRTGLTPLPLYGWSIDYGKMFNEPPYVYTKDSEFEIFAIPYCDDNITIYDDRAISTGFKKVVNQTKELARDWVNNIIDKYSGTPGFYDAQLVPYCPLDNELLDFSDYTAVEKLVKIVNNEYTDEVVACGFRLRTSQFTQNISLNSMYHMKDLKESNELELYRLTSPNGMGNYDFSLAKNNFEFTGDFEADITLKPINPYIKINPKFSNDGLYGGDFNDYRGLICSGDFSLALFTSEWKAYELNNKNYQKVFNREIDTLDKSNTLNLIRDIASVGGGAVGGTVSGAVAGTMVGGPPGALVGGALGGTASGIGGVADILMNEGQRELNKRLKIDAFNMSHENVKARGVSLTRGTLFNINNKIFPYVEYYSCTEDEKQYFRNYINLKSYTIGIIDQPIQFIDYGKFIQGTIIDIDIDEDYHLVDAMNNYFEIGFRLEEKE